MDDVVVPEKTLVQRAKAGDVDAFEQLYRSYNQRIYNFARQIVASDQDASDVVQETFIRVWQALPKLRCEEAFKGWLYRIALSRSKELLYHRSGKAEMSLDAGTHDGDGFQSRIAASGDGPEDAVCKSEMMGALSKAVTELAPDHKAVIAMHHLEGMEVTEISKILEVPVGTILSRLARARAILRRKLTPYVENG